MLNSVADLIQRAADALFVPWLLVLLFGTGLFLTVRYRFMQVRRFRAAFRSMLGAQDAGASGALSPFQAFMTALSGTIGTGNIAGVATAIVSGGPGALFWIWAYGFVATTIKFTEAVLGVTWRQVGANTIRSGPMYALRDGMKLPWLASTYALIAGVAAISTTPFTQPNSIAIVLQSELGVPTWAAGVGIAVLVWLVIVGGIGTIGRAAEKLAPLKVGLYLGGGLIVIAAFASEIPSVLSLVFQEAFSMRATAGGTLGFVVAMRFGLARGMYANEAGYGTASVAYGTARSRNPEQQGLQAVMEVAIVSFVTSTISAMAILLTGAWKSGLTSTAAVASAFDAAMPGVGGYVVALCAFLFGYTTLIGWAFYGEQFFEYLLDRPVAHWYRWTYCLLIPFGAIGRVEVVWAWGDLMNALQIFPNLVGVIGLSGFAARIARGRAPQ